MKLFFLAEKEKKSEGHDGQTIGASNG